MASWMNLREENPRIFLTYDEHSAVTHLGAQKSSSLFVLNLTCMLDGLESFLNILKPRFLSSRLALYWSELRLKIGNFLSCLGSSV